MLEGQVDLPWRRRQVEVHAGEWSWFRLGEPHGFNASGDGSRRSNIHVSPRFVTEWLEEEAYG